MKRLTERIDLRVDKELYRMLKAEAVYMGIPIAEVVRKMLWGYFERKREYKDDEERFRAIMDEVVEEMDRTMAEFLREVATRRREDPNGGK